MSEPIDFAAILGDRLAHSIQGEPITDIYTPTGVGTYQLAAKVSELCPDCDGVGHFGPATGAHQRDYGRACAHLNAPTIAELLTIGRRTWVATYAQGAGI